MMHTIGTAATATGKSKSTISRAINNGIISATKQPNGAFAIDPAELHRVYPPVALRNGSENGDANDTQPPETSIGTVALRAELEFLHEQMAAMNMERDRERKQLTDQIEDLRGRLDRAEQERGRLTAVLTDQRPNAEILKPSEGIGFWQWFRRRRA